jgi:N-acetylmuramoyl-L-alanine amidase
VRRGAPLALVATTIVSLLATAAAGQQLILTRDAVEPLPILGSVDSEDLTPPDDPMLIEPGAVVAPPSLTEAAIAVASAAPAGPAFPTASPEIKYTRVARPTLTGPRRVGIQAGHWLTTEAPPELWRLVAQTGTAWNGVREVDINLDIANRVKAILVPKGIVVDVLPTTIPPGYLADAFVALHGDGDGSGERSGFKMAYVTRRTPYEQDLLLSIKDTYKKQTGLEYDAGSVSRSMLGYYAMSWQRYKWATNPHTPSVIMEMGYVSNDGDRELMTEHADVVATAIASGILRFLDDHPRDKLFGQDLLVPALPAFGPAPAPSPRG